MTDLHETTGPEELEEIDEFVDEEPGDPPRRLPWLILLGLLALAVLGGGIYYAWHKANDGKGRRVPVEVTGRPSLRVDRPRIDLRELKMGTPATATFEVANVGDQTLRLDPAPYAEVVKGCCTPFC